ncbi:hypothetical protein [Paenibacillus sp. MBLB4367]|uniref:hypothetical protein n=1 Tax=Paenibacillus sp. MBLB4367 TaxID=3384767 RepID=UPI003908160C
MNAEKQRYVVSPYSYYGESSRPRSWSVWDSAVKEWTGEFVGSKTGAEEASDALNYKYHECHSCGFVQVDTATVEVMKCDRCNHTYYPA